VKCVRPASHKAAREGATLIEFGCCLTILAAAVIGFSAGKHWYGWLGGAAGAFLLPAALLSLGWLGVFLTAWIFGSVPNFPPCPNRCCRSADYNLDFTGLVRDWTWKCQCGIRFRKLGRGSRRLMIVNPDNSHTPYMRYVPCLGWRKDNGQGTGPCW
jgi:hypothetical protein